MKHKKHIWSIIMISMALLCSCDPLKNEEDAAIYQVGPAIALLNGVYDGQYAVGEIKLHGDQGLGTWNQLDGEGIILDGHFYQVLSDGSVHEQTDDAIMPFAQLSHFRADKVVEVPNGLNFNEVEEFIDQQIGTVNAYYALKLEGEFDSVQTRSLPKQSKPYPPFWKVEETEPKFNFSDIKGTMVGFRSPPYTTNMDPVGYHFHFLTENRDGGGHVLSMVTRNTKIHLQRIKSFQVVFPNLPEFDHANLNQIDTPTSP